MLHNSLRVARKELDAFFASAVAYIFVGVFLLVAMFSVFWGEAFFARNIADIRPLFKWMPLLLVFLVAALTMRMWSEERRMGTIEYMFTMPVARLDILLGKFIACMTLLAVALLLTVPLPLLVAHLGPLDWGPVWGGYVAALCLGAAYIAIGLYVSARSENQIVSLIATVLVCGVFYLIGSDVVVSFFPDASARVMRLLGSGSRFASITRGVIDLRDLYYYFSIVVAFMALTLHSLNRLGGGRGGITTTVALVAAVLAGNVLLQPFTGARIDLTQGRIYSISPATRHYLAQLKQPLLIRGYFSARTHPLLAPLVPRLQDLAREYQLAGNGKVTVEFVDPQQHPDLEAEANQKYAIKPVPFQVADRYQAALVNSYFYLLIKYGDEFQVLGFKDLIDVKQQGEGHFDVDLRNPEYEITRCIKKVLYASNSSGDLFSKIPRKVTLTAYVSATAKLPDFLRKFKGEMEKLVAELSKKAGDKLTYSEIDPEADGARVARRIEADYGFMPMQTGLFDRNSFYFYLTLSDGDQVVQVPLPQDFSADALKQNLKAALQRFSSGYLKTVALALPSSARMAPFMAQFGMGANAKHYDLLRHQLMQNHNVRDIDLNQQQVPDDADILLVVAADDLNDKGLFAMDQFLMRGGTVVVAASPFKVDFSREGLTAEKQDSPLLEWLAHNGITMEKQLVLDERNQPFPLPVTRKVGDFTLHELRLIPYPYFIDVCGDGLNHALPVTAGLNRVLMNWAAPLKWADDKQAPYTVVPLLQSSNRAWLSDQLDLLPRLNKDGSSAFAVAKKRAVYTLAASVQGRFESWFKGKKSPLVADKQADKDKKGKNSAADKNKADTIAAVVEHSPDATRLIVFSSADFLSDQTLRLAASVSGQNELGALQVVENTLDWALEDPQLLTIRTRGQYVRTLIPLSRAQQRHYEYLLYASVLLGLLLVFACYRLRRSVVQKRYRALLAQ